MGALARRRPVSPPLWTAAAQRGHPRGSASARARRRPHCSGAHAVIGLFDFFARPLMRALDPEDAHALAVKALKLAPLPAREPDDPKLAVRAFGLNFPNPIGMAAGFDKHAEVPDPLLRLGFGFVEI